MEFIRQSGEHRTTFVSRYLTALGREGWSLEATHRLGRPDTGYFVFARPVAEAEAATGASS